MIIKDLIAKLQVFDPESRVECTWEGTFNDIQVYLHRDGRVLIDGDRGDYRERFEASQ